MKNVQKDKGHMKTYSTYEQNNIRNIDIDIDYFTTVTFTRDDSFALFNI
jgi:hypothetical protein